MLKTTNKINELNQLLVDKQNETETIQSELQAEYNKAFDDCQAIQDAIKAVESSNEYTWDRYGEISQWVRFDFSDFKTCKEYLENYLRDSHFIHCDFQNDSLLYSLGPSIIINGDGTVYDQDSDKLFIKPGDYRTDDGDLDDTKRNELIEAYMEKTGYFPGVFKTDHYGNVFNVKTTR